MREASFNTIRKVLLSEKAYSLSGSQNTYMFEVAIGVDKRQVKAAVEDIYSVKVAAVHTLIRRGKVKRQKAGSGKRPNIKKAYVTLKKGQTLPIYEGV